MKKDTIKELKQICPAWGWFIEQGDNMYDSVSEMNFEYENKNYQFNNTHSCVVGEFWNRDDSYLHTCLKCDDFCVKILSHPPIHEESDEPDKDIYYYFSENKIKEFIKHVKESHKDMIKQ